MARVKVHINRKPDLDGSAVCCTLSPWGFNVPLFLIRPSEGWADEPASAPDDLR